METFVLYGPISCALTGSFLQLLGILTAVTGSFDLHGLILYVSEGLIF